MTPDSLTNRELINTHINDRNPVIRILCERLETELDNPPSPTATPAGLDTPPTPVVK